MSMGWKLLLRDLAIVAITLAAWRLSAQGAWIAVIAGVLAAVAGFLAHEWGHWLGARAAGAAVYFPVTLRSLFLFQFDVARNGRRQFLWMSMGGFIASAAIVALYAAVLPRGQLAGQVGLGLTVLGVIATGILEIPPAWRVYKGGPLPSEGAVYRAT